MSAKSIDGAKFGPAAALEQFQTIAEGLDHPEGVACGPDGVIYAGGEIGQIYRSAAPAVPGMPVPLSQFATTGGFILGLALDARSNVYACDPGQRQVAKITPEGAVYAYSRGTAATAMVNPNFPVFDQRGRLYVADSGRWQQNDGLIFRIDPNGTTQVISDAPHRFPNGLALSPDGAWLYVAESTLPGVTRLRIAADGSLGELEDVVYMPGDVPDGLAFDAAGALYITCYRPDRIYRFSQPAGLTVFAEDPAGTVLAAPTNIAFYGPRLDHLAVANLGRWHLAAVRMDVPGQPLHYPDLG